MIVLSDGKDTYNFYGSISDVKRLVREGFRATLYKNGTEHIMKFDGLFIVREEVV